MKEADDQAFQAMINVVQLYVRQDGLNHCVV